MRLQRLLVVGADSHYGHQVVKGIHAYCQAHGKWEYRLGRNNSPEAVTWAKRAVVGWKPDGIIAHILSDRVEQFVRECGLPAVNVSNTRELKTRVPTVIPDGIAIGRMVARYFMDNGFRHFASCAENVEQKTRRERLEGFAEELARAGQKCEVFINRCADDTQPGWVKNQQNMTRWLQGLAKPVGVMCVEDSRAQEVAWACARAGIKVPDEVAIVGAGNQEFMCQACVTPLSTVDPNIEQVGYEAAALLDRMLAGEEVPAEAVRVSPRGVVMRRSSDFLAVEDPDIAEAIRYIRDHAHEPISVKDLLGKVPISRKTMERRFEKLIGRTPRQEIMRVRIERAKSLLGATDMPIKAVAQNSGLVDPRAFSAFFRRLVGVVPSEYRRVAQIR